MPIKDLLKRKHHHVHIASVNDYSLIRAVTFIGISATVISAVTWAVTCIAIVMIIKSDSQNLSRASPMVAINLIIALVVCPMSLYQFIISALLVYQAVKLGGNAFITSIWFTSHISILFIYGTLFIVKGVFAAYHKYYLNSVITFLAALGYESVFIYFEIIVNSYYNHLDKY